MATKIDMEIAIPRHQTILDESGAVLPTLTDLSMWYVKGANAVNYPSVAATVGQDIAFGTSFTDEDLNASDDSFTVTNKLGGTFKFNLHTEHQNVLNGEEIKMEGILRAIARQADHKVVAAMIAGAASANNVTKASSGNTIRKNIIDMKAKLRSAGVPMNDGELYSLLTADDETALEFELSDKRRFETDKTGILDVISGVQVLQASSSMDSSVLTASMVYHRSCLGFAWGPNYVALKDEVVGDSAVKYEVSRAFGCKVLQAGKFISKLLPAA